MTGGATINYKCLKSHSDIIILDSSSLLNSFLISHCPLLVWLIGTFFFFTMPMKTEENCYKVNSCLEPLYEKLLIHKEKTLNLTRKRRLEYRRSSAGSNWNPFFLEWSTRRLWKAVDQSLLVIPIFACDPNHSRRSIFACETTFRYVGLDPAEHFYLCYSSCISLSKRKKAW